MTRHNFLQRRSRLLKQIRIASDAYLWHMNGTHPQTRRGCTFAAKRMMQATRELWRLGTIPKSASPKGRDS